MLPDSRLGTNGFHDVLIDNLTSSPFWRLGHISLADVTALCQRWPKAVFKTMRRRAQEVERLRRGARHRPDWAFRHSAPGFCPVCEVRIDSALDVHMLNFHLELAQLWRCPVEWCAVWKGSVQGCLDHLTDKHGGSTFFDLKNVAKFFPPWMVTRDVWQAALRPDVSGIAVDAHASSMRPDVDWYIGTVYKDPFPHPALRGGGGGCDSLSTILRLSGDGHRPAYPTQDLHSCVGGTAWPGTSRLLYRWRFVAGPAEFASCVVCQGCYGVGGCSAAGMFAGGW